MMIRLSRESMEAAFIKYLETVFEHPEIIRASVRNIVINRENTEDAGKRAFEAGFHDCFSDIDFNLSLAKRTYACEQSESYCVLQEKVTKSGHGFSGRCRRRIMRCCLKETQMGTGDNNLYPFGKGLSDFCHLTGFFRGFHRGEGVRMQNCCSRI